MKGLSLVMLTALLAAGAAATCPAEPPATAPAATQPAAQVDNPAYKAWASFKPGSTVIMRNTAEGTETKSASLTKLLQVTPEKVQLEVTGSSGSGGNVRTFPAKIMEIPARIDKNDLERALATNEDSGKPRPEGYKTSGYKSGHESIEVAGKKYEAVTHEMTAMFSAGGRDFVTHTKYWRAEEVPGGVIRVETKEEKPFTLNFVSTVVEFTVAK